MTKEKFKILDDAEMRKAIAKEYKNSSQVKLCRYSLLLSMHILEMIKYPEMDYTTIIEGFLVNEQWQKGNARTREVRQAGFKIHQMSKAYKDDITRTALEIVGHAVATAYMKEHAIVASDYAVKVINLLHPDDLEAAKNERKWQLNHLQEIKDF